MSENQQHASYGMSQPYSLRSTELPGKLLQLTVR